MNTPRSCQRQSRTVEPSFRHPQALVGLRLWVLLICPFFGLAALIAWQGAVFTTSPPGGEGRLLELLFGVPAAVAFVSALLICRRIGDGLMYAAGAAGMTILLFLGLAFLVGASGGFS
jgi:hypothetical protein